MPFDLLRLFIKETSHFAAKKNVKLSNAILSYFDDAINFVFFMLAILVPPVCLQPRVKPCNKLTVNVQVSDEENFLATMIPPCKHFILPTLSPLRKHDHLTGQETSHIPATGCLAD